MEFIHFVNREEKENVLKNGITASDGYRGFGILIYPNFRINFKAPNPDYKKEEEKANRLTIEKAWATIATSASGKQESKFSAVFFQCKPKDWPIKVFIDVRDEIAAGFAKSFDLLNTTEITYSGSRKFSEVVNSIESLRFVLEGAFQVHTETGFRQLIDCYTNAGGGIWAGHSFDCMILENISPESIIKIIDL